MSRFFRTANDSDSDSSSSESDESMSSGDEGQAPKQAVPGKAIGMSRFLKTGSDSSDSSDESDSDSDSDSEDENKSGDEDEDEEKVQRVLSAQERRLLEMEATGKVMDNALRINDWVAISNGMFSAILHPIRSRLTLTRIRQTDTDGAASAQRFGTHSPLLPPYSYQPRDHGIRCAYKRKGKRSQEAT